MLLADAADARRLADATNSLRGPRHASARIRAISRRFAAAEPILTRCAQDYERVQRSGQGDVVSSQLPAKREDGADEEQDPKGRHRSPAGECVEIFHGDFLTDACGAMRQAS